MQGGFITQSYLGWRWTAWITLIMAALFGGIGVILIPETSAPRILQIRAKNLRYKTKNWALHAKADEHRIDAKTILTVYLVRPFVMLVQEPILALITMYMSFIYGILYLLFEAVRLIHWSYLLTLTDLSIVSHHIPGTTRMERRGRRFTFHLLRCRYYHGGGSNCIFDLHQLQESFRKTWQTDPRRTITTHDHRCNRPSDWLVLVWMVYT